MENAGESLEDILGSLAKKAYDTADIVEEYSTGKYFSYVCDCMRLDADSPDLN